MVGLSEYEQWKQKQAQASVGAASVVIGAQDRGPDEVAGDLNLATEFARTTGNPQPPAPMVAEYRNVFQKAIEEKRASTILSTSPRLTEWLRDPTNAAIGRDDLEGLSWWETGLGAAGNAVSRGIQRVPQSYNQLMAATAAERAGDAERSFSEILMDSRNPVMVDGQEVSREFVGPVDLVQSGLRWFSSRVDMMGRVDQQANAVGFQRQAGEWANAIQNIPMSPAGERFKGVFADLGKSGDWKQDVRDFGAAVAADPGAFSAFLFETAAESVPSLAVATGVTAATRSPAAGAMFMGGQSALTEAGTAPVQFFQEKGIDVSTPEGALQVVSDPALMREAMDRGVIRGTIIGALDGLSGGLAGQVLSRSPAGNMALQALAQAFLGGGGEAAAQVASGQELNIAEVLIEGLAEFATAPIEVAGVGGRAFLDGRRKAQDAEARQAVFQELSGQAVNSKVRARMPDKFKDLVAQATANGPVENVYVPAEQFRDYFQSVGVDPYSLVEGLDGVSRDDFDAALAGGGDLQIPTSTYAAHIAGSEHDAFLMENMRFDPDEFTAAEARDFNARVDEIRAQAEEAQTAAFQEEQFWRSTEQTIYDTMVERLRIAGRSTDVATSEALLYPAFYRAMAERSQLTTEEFLQQYPLPQVQGAIPQGMQARDVDEFTRTLAAARSFRGRRSAGGAPSLLEFIADRGGIVDRGGELKARDAATVKRGRKNLQLLREDNGQGSLAGMGSDTGRRYGPDDVAQAAIEAGFMEDNPIVQEYRAALERGDEAPDITRALWDEIDAELRGREAVDPNAEPDQAAYFDEIEAYLDKAGVTLDDEDAAIRAAIEAFEAGGDGRAYAQAVETDQPLYVVHNLSAENLRRATDLGGLAAPSLAVARGDIGFDNFGEISLIGAPSLADPKSKGVRLFSADIYSPRQPRARYKVVGKELRAMRSVLQPVADKYGFDIRFDDSDIERGGLSEVAATDVAKAAWLEAKGEAVPVVMEAPEAPPAPPVGFENIKGTQAYDVAQAEGFEEAAKAFWNSRLDLASSPTSRAKIMEMAFDADGNLTEDAKSRAARTVANTNAQIANRSIEASGRMDRYRTSQAIDAAISGREGEFNSWLREQFGGVTAATFFETEAGRKKDYTLENIVREMTRTIRNGENWNYGSGNVRAAVAPEFKTLKDAQAARGQIVSEEAFEPLKDEVNSELVALADKFAAYSPEGERFGWSDTFAEFLRDMAKGPRAVAGWDFAASVPPELMAEAGAFLEKLKGLPTAYFEIKMQRAMDVSEFTAALIPADLAPDARQILQDAGLELVEYQRGENAAAGRAAALASIGPRVFFQNPEGPRGQIQIPGDGIGPNSPAIISLFETANLSTFVHESGHYFLTVMQDMAARGEPGATTDFEGVKTWWRENAAAVAADGSRVGGAAITATDVERAIDTGTTGDAAKDAAVDVGMQEQFARGFEQYLMEGRAPSAELRGAFEKFRAWMVSVYKKLTGLNVKVSEEMRGVFDRMLASDAEIARAKQEAGQSANVLPTAEAMGLTDEEYQRFLTLRDQAEQSAQARLLREIMEPVRREQAEWYKAEKAKVREAVTAEVNAMRQYRAIEWMGNRRWLDSDAPEGLGDMRMSKDILVDRYGEGVLKTLPRGRQAVYAVEGGVDPDDAAGWFGFGSGDEMIRAMETAPKRSDAIRDETERRMYELHGDPMKDGAMEAAALDAVHTDRRGEWIAAELKAIAEVADTDPGLTSKQARAAARDTISRMKVRDAMNANRFLSAERKAGEEAARLGAMLAREKVWQDAARRRIAVKGRAGDVAGVPGQIDQANRSTLRRNETVQKFVQAKRRQLLNHALYMEARKVADEVGAAERYVAKLGKASTREKIAGAGRREGAQIDYLGAIDEVMTRYDFRRMSARGEDRRGALQAYVDAMTAAGRENELAIPEKVMRDAARAPYKTLPVEELRGVVDTLKNLEHVALRWNKLIDGQQQRALDEAVAGVVEGIEANLPKRPPGRVNTRMEALRNAGRQYLDLVLNASTMLREIDGFKEQGAAYQAIKAPIDAAMNRLTERRMKAAEDMDALYAVYSKAERRRMAVREFVPELGYSLSKWEKIAVALNTGNAGNLQRMTDPKVRGSMTQDQVDAILRTLDERDASFIQSVWDYVGSFRADIAAREKRTTGVEPAWVEASPVTIAGRTLTGGYYPLKYDPRLSSLARDDQANEIAQSLQSGRFGKAQTKNGHTKERATSSGRAVDLDMSVLHRHIQQVIHDLELSEPVANSWRILQNGQVRDALRNAGRAADFDAMEIWLKDVAEGQVNAGDWVSVAARTAKSNFTAAKLALNLSTVAMQVTGVAQTMVVVGKKDFALGVQSMFRQGVGGIGQVGQEVAAKSSFMRERQTTFNKDIYDFYNDPKLGPTASRWGDFKREIWGPLSFWMMTKVQYYSVDLPSWLAGYQKGLRDYGGDEARAIALADDMVKRAQASGLFSDAPAIQRGSVSAQTRQNAVVRLFTTLGSYMFAKFNVAYERSLTAQREFTGAESKTKAAIAALSWAVDMTFLFTVEAVMVAVIKGRLPDEEEDEDDTWGKFLAKETAMSVLGTMPFIRDVASTASGFEGGGAYGGITKEIAEPFKQMTGEFDAGLVKSIINATGLATGIPSTQINRAVDAGWREVEGQDVSPLEYILGKLGK